MVTIATLTAQDKTETQAEVENSLLWKISGNGLEEPSFIYGTMHMGDERILQYGDSVKGAIDAVDAVYGELDLTDIVGQMSAMKDMLMLDKTLGDLVSESDYALIKKTLEGNPAGLMMDQVKPFFTMGNMATMLLPTDNIVVIDLHFQQLAKSLGKEVGGVETMKEQMAAIDVLTLEEQAEMLVEFCKELEEQKKLFSDMYEAYLNEDLSELTEIANSEMEDMESKDFEDALLKKRNKVMVKRLVELMKEKTVFFAVGALHLSGEDGLITLFRNLGYTVEPVKKSVKE